MVSETEELAFRPEQAALLREQTAEKNTPEQHGKPFRRVDCFNDTALENQGVVFRHQL